MKNLYLLTLLCLTSALTAQTVSGRLTDTDDAPLPDVYLLNLRSLQHVHTDPLGNFRIPATTGDTLRISHLGYGVTDLVIADPTAFLSRQLEAHAVALDQITVSPGIDPQERVADLDLRTRPVNSAQDVLRQVPGLIIGQHAGGGKAEQIFLRGFDIDHGTDIAISVDGLPVNMVSHAHGQGYADLHFVIPETIERVRFGKGPYDADRGNFATAGYVAFRTRDRLDNNLIKTELGSFGTRRLVGLFDLSGTRNDAYLAAEYLATDGPFEVPQDFRRLNALAKFGTDLPNGSRLNLLASHFTSDWDASGQVPQRAVDAGQISRFGAIDATEGGQTSRTNASVEHLTTFDNGGYLRNQVWASHYDFTLFSNFTFFLEDPEDGDQIRQREDRFLYGLNSTYDRAFRLGDVGVEFRGGLHLREDRSMDNELANTVNRRELQNYVQLGDVTETNVGTFVEATFRLGRFSVNPGLRYDRFGFRYLDDLAGTYAPERNDGGILSPKLRLAYDASSALQLYLRGGRGFHSNDTRVSVRRTTPEVLPAALGLDAGLVWKPLLQLFVNAAYWYLHLEQEFVYVGDAGIVEPSGETERQGVDLSLRYQARPWLLLNLDANYAHARALGEPEGSDFIPLAPDLTAQAGLSILHPSGFYAGSTLRFVDDRPANEDNSIVAEGYTVIDLNAGYRWSRLDLGFRIENLLDMDWNEAQFATESRLLNEARPVEELHFTPGTPFLASGVVTVRF